MSHLPRVGELRTKLALQTPVAVHDPLGGFAQQWQTIAEVWCAIETSAPQVAYEGAHRRSVVARRVVLRWRPDIHASMRLTGESGTFLILAVQDIDARRAFLACHCEEITS
ncbi:MAG: phage head closure protein [Beijerinckiaceae bacterium]